MSNAIARNWSWVNYQDLNTCGMAVSELTTEENRLNNEVKLMETIKGQYENDVIPHLSEASSQMVTHAEVRLEKAIVILEESYQTNEKELIDSLNETNDSIGSAKNRITNLQNIVEANIAHLNELIRRYQGEIEEVKAQIVRANEERKRIFQMLEEQRNANVEFVDEEM